MAAINHGIILTPEIENVLDRNPFLTLHCSGGKDSELIAHLIHKLFGKTHHITTIHNDTGWEYQATAEWPSTLEWVQARTAQYDSDLHVLHPIRDFFDETRYWKRWPSNKERFCTSALKRAPSEKWTTHRKESIIIHIDGRRAAESPAREKLVPWSLDTKLTTKRAKLTKSPRTVYTWMPIHDWPTQDVYDYLAAQSIPLHPVYEWLPRLSCQVCIFHSPELLARIRKRNPAGFARARALEIELGKTLIYRKGAKVSIDQAADEWEAKQAELLRLPTPPPAPILPAGTYKSSKKKGSSKLLSTYQTAIPLDELPCM